MINRSDIEKLIDEVAETCQSWIRVEKDEQFRFFDPLDHEEISAHYGVTHVAAGLIIYGEETDKIQFSKKGYELFNSVLARWVTSSSLPDFHNDFNNFALCVIWSYTQGQQDCQANAGKR